MSTHHRHDLEIEMYICGKPVDITAEIEYEVTPEWPAGRDDPGGAAECHIMSVMLVVHGVPHWSRGYRIKCPTWLECFIYDNKEVERELLEAADYGRPYRDPDDMRDERLGL